MKFMKSFAIDSAAVAAMMMASAVSAAVLENDKVKVEIGARGELKSLVCKSTRHNWAGGAQLWRLYFDDKRGGFEEKETPVLGGEQTPKIFRAADKIVIEYDSLVCRSKRFDAKLTLTVTLDADGLVRFASALENREAHTCIRELHYPLVGDCNLPKDAELLTTFLGGARFKDPVTRIVEKGNEPPYFGRNWEFRQIDCKYPSHTVANCFAFLNDREGLYLGSHDPTFRDTWHGLRVYPEKPMTFTRLETGLYKYPNLLCGGMWRNDSNVLAPYAGDWKTTSRIYRKWADTWWSKRPAPEWVKKMTGWQRIVFRHQYGVTHYTPQDVAGKIWGAGRKAGIDSLLCFGWWKTGMDNGYPDSYFTTDPETGGDGAWKKAIGDYQSKGGRFHLYFNGKLIDLESDYFRNGPGKDICYRDNTGAVYTEQYRFKGTGTFTGYLNTRTFTPADQRSEIWRALLRKMVDRAIDFGADSVFFDQLGYCEYSSTWKTGGEFPMPDTRIIAHKAETLRMLHDYLDKTAPEDFAIGTECFTDVCAQHVDYVHNLINPSKPTDFSEWLRYTFPEVPITDREIRDDTDVKWRVNHNLLLGLRADGETFRCQRTLDFAPAHQKRLGQINALRATYPVLMETYRDTDGLANSNPGAILARVFTDGKRLAAVACTAKGKAASGEIKVTGWTPVSSEGIDDARITIAGDTVKLDLPADALAVIEFSP